MQMNLVLKLVIPLVFFGYAAAANLSLVRADGGEVPLTQSVMTGELSKELDRLYRENLPHKEPSIGLLGALRYVVLGEGRKGVIVGDDGYLFTIEEFRDVDEAVYAHGLDMVGEAQTALAARGVDLVVVPLPAKIDLLRDRAPDASYGVTLEKLYQRFVHDLEDNGISVVDSRPALASTDAPFIATDTHWTPEGALNVAKAIANSGAIVTGEDGFVTEEDPTVSLVGDLVTYVTSDNYAELIGLDPVDITPYRAIPAVEETGTLDIFGGTGGAVDLVGTSYSANPNWSFAESLKLSLGRDVINYAEEGQGPFEPMQGYLASLDPLALPEAVIWEIPIRYLTDPALLDPSLEGS